MTDKIQSTTLAQPEKVTPDAASWLRNLEVRAVNFSITWGMGGSYAKMLAAFAAQEIAAQPLAAPVETKPDWCQGADAICHHPACACVPWDTAAPVETDEIAGLKAEVERLRDAKRRALALADEHGKELAALRLARSSAGNVGLKPCPHCGGRADFNNDGERWDQVICDSCGCRGCEYPNNREKAAAAWNLRSEALSATEGNDLLGEMKHGHAEPVADRHYAWAVAEITGLRQKVSRLIDEASHTDLRASGGLFPDEPQEARLIRGSMAAQWTYDPEVEAYYFAPLQAAKPPYLTQRHVDAILDIASDGTLAGVELIDNVPPPPTAALPRPEHSRGET